MGFDYEERRILFCEDSRIGCIVFFYSFGFLGSLFSWLEVRISDSLVKVVINIGKVL